MNIWPATDVSSTMEICSQQYGHAKKSSIGQTAIKAPSERRATLRHLRRSILLLLVLKTISRPRNSFQARRFNLTSTLDALAISAVFDAAQGVLHFDQSPRCQSVLLQRFRCS